MTHGEAKPRTPAPLAPLLGDAPTSDGELTTPTLLSPGVRVAAEAVSTSGRHHIRSGRLASEGLRSEGQANAPSAQAAETGSGSGSVFRFSSVTIQPNRQPSLASRQEDPTELAIPYPPLQDPFGELEELPSAERSAPPPEPRARRATTLTMAVLCAVLAGAAGGWLALVSAGTEPSKSHGSESGRHPAQGSHAPATQALEPTDRLRSQARALDVPARERQATTAADPRLEAPQELRDPDLARRTKNAALSPKNAAQPTKNATPASAQASSDGRSTPLPNARTHMSAAKPAAGATEQPVETAEKQREAPAATPIFRWGEG